LKKRERKHKRDTSLDRSGGSNSYIWIQTLAIAPLDG
jgi:hypothetical protein